MTNYKLLIQYDGGRYDGWQRQGNTGNTIQGKLEHVLGEMAGHRVEIHAAGRTDAGVHARAQTASFQLQTAFTLREIRDYCNRYLPDDIAVLSCEAADERFHARLHARAKRYVYRLWTGETPNVFERRYLTPRPEPLDLNAMRRAAALLTGTHDFRAFCSNKRYKKSTVRTIFEIKIERLGDEVRLRFFGDGFLYNMVRILTGTLVEVGMGQRSPESMAAILESRDRQQAGITMPPQGLILEEVLYENA
ncbi:MAG: tRNA pseudouridine(38-40) synthase TruA [Intestinibacillus sp.]